MGFSRKDTSSPARHSIAPVCRLWRLQLVRDIKSRIFKESSKQCMMSAFAKGPYKYSLKLPCEYIPRISLCSTPTSTHTQKSSHSHLLARIFNPPDFKTVHEVCRQLRAFAGNDDFVMSSILLTSATCTFPVSFHEYICLFCWSLTCHVVDPLCFSHLACSQPLFMHN